MLIAYSYPWNCIDAKMLVVARGDGTSRSKSGFSFSCSTRCKTIPISHPSFCFHEIAGHLKGEDQELNLYASKGDSATTTTLSIYQSLKPQHYQKYYIYAYFISLNFKTRGKDGLACENLNRPESREAGLLNSGYNNTKR